MWQPTTRSVCPSTTSLISTVVSRPDKVAFSGRNIAINVGLRKPRAGLRLGKPYSADFRFREDGRRHVGEVGRCWPAAEHGISEGCAFADGDGREIDAVGDVADGIDTWHAGPRIFVYGDATIIGDLNPRLLQTELGNLWRPPRGEHGAVGPDLRAAGEPGDKVRLGSLDRCNLATGKNANTSLFHVCAHVLANVVVKTAQ